MNQPVRGRQCWSLLLLFLTGWALTTSSGSRDGWIAVLAAAGIGLLLTALFSVPSEQIEGNYVAILHTAYGKIGGIVCTLVLSLLAFWGLCMSALSLVIFLRTTAEGLWPVGLIAVCVVLLAGFIAIGGVERMALWAEPVVWIVLAALVLSLALTLPDADFGQLRPMLAQGWDRMSTDAAKVLAVPFAECWFVIALLSGRSVRMRQSCLLAVLLAGLLLAATALRNVAVLGQAGADAVWYPTFTAAGLIEIGKSFQRGEVLVSGSLLLCGAARTAVFLCFLTDGITETFPQLSRRVTVWTAGAICVLLCVLFAGSTWDFQRAELLYELILLPVLVLFAVVTAVVAVQKAK